MSSSQIGGAVGAVIGAVGAYYTGDYELIAEGYTIGSGLGTLIAPPHTYGPTLNDLKVQTSSYGVDIPERWGAGRQACNVIWQSDLEQHAVDDSSKGGSTNTSYKYTFSTALGLCKGPITGIGRIWANKKVWGDFRPANPNPLNDSRLGTLRVYLGTETQDPDPLLEAMTGPDSPAYRGFAYIVLEGVDGTDTQGRIQWEVEVFADGDAGVHYHSFAALTPANSGNPVDHGRAWITARKAYWGRGGYFFRSLDGGPVEFAGPVSYPGSSGVTGGFSPAIPINTQTWPAFAIPFVRNDPNTDANIPRQIVHVGFLEDSPFVSGRTVCNGIVFSEQTSLLGNNVLVAYDEDTDVTAIAKREYRTFYTNNFFAERIFVTSRGTPVILGIPPQVVGYDEIVIGQHAIASTEIICALAATDGKIFAMIYDGSRMRLLVLSQKDLSVLDDIVGPATAPDLGATDVQESIRVDGNTVYAWCATDGFAWRWSLADGSYRMLATGVNIQKDDGTISTALGGNQIYIDDSGMINTSEDNVANSGQPTTYRMQHITFNAATGDAVPLSKIVSDICAEAELSEDDIDVTDLEGDMVPGYTRSKQMTARAAIEPLQQAYFFDAVESDFKIRFVKRGAAVAATIPLDDRAAHVLGEDMPDHLSIVRENELEVASLVDVQYADPDADYLIGDQYERRLTKRVDSSVRLNLPMTMSADKARQIAATSLYSAWLTTTFSFSTTRKYAHLEPTDIVRLPTADAEYVARITTKSEQPNGVIDWQATIEDAEVYTQTMAGASLGYAPTTLQVPASTDLAMLDIPILQDADDNSGAYAKATPTGPYWKGAVVALVDNGDPVVLGTVTNVSVYGRAVGVLPDYVGIESFDESSFIDVQFPGKMPVSVTRAEALGGANAFLVGSGLAGAEEIIVARDVTLLGPQQCRLSGLLRRQRATTSTVHAIGDRVVMLEQAGMLRFDQGVGDLNVAHKYAGISFGRTLANSDKRYFTNTGVGMRPFPPVQLGAGVTSTNDVLFSWRRQTRYSAPLRDRVGASLGETTEAYDLEISDTAAFTTVRRAYSLTGPPPLTYPALDRRADEIAGLPTPFYWRVAQRSARYGDGLRSVVASLNVTPVPPPPDPDPTFSNVSLLLHGEGTPGASVITDSSGGARATIATGSVKTTTSHPKFGSTSLELTGSTNARWAASVDFRFPSGTDFTIEAWVFVPTGSGLGNAYLIACDASASAAGRWALGFQGAAGSGKAAWYLQGSPLVIDTVAFPTGAFVHLAACRSGTTTRLFVNGTSVGTPYTTDTTDYTYVNPLSLFGSSDAGSLPPTNTCVDEVRITKSVARYTANFTPSAAPFFG